MSRGSGGPDDVPAGVQRRTHHVCWCLSGAVWFHPPRNFVFSNFDCIGAAGDRIRMRQCFSDCHVTGQSRSIACGLLLTSCVVLSVPITRQYLCDVNIYAQVGALLGFTIPNYSGQSASLFRTYVYAFSHLSYINWAEVICAISSIVLMVLIKKTRFVRTWR